MEWYAASFTIVGKVPGDLRPEALREGKVLLLVAMLLQSLIICSFVSSIMVIWKCICMKNMGELWSWTQKSDHRCVTKSPHSRKLLCSDAHNGRGQVINLLGYGLNITHFDWVSRRKRTLIFPSGMLVGKRISSSTNSCRVLFWVMTTDFSALISVWDALSH